MPSGSGQGTPLTGVSTWYATVAEFKARAYPAGLVDTDDDDVIEAVIEAVSRLIDNYTGDRFYTTASDETRYEVAEWADLLLPRYGIVSLTTLATDADGDGTYEATWSATDYALAPYNNGLDSRPYTMIETTTNGNYTFPVGTKKGVKLVGKFGWTTAPAPVCDACLLQAIRLFKRKDAPFGVVGSADMGQMVTISKLDPDVMLLLQAFRKMTVGAV